MERSPINDFELGVLVLQDGRHSACRNLPEVKEYHTYASYFTKRYSDLPRLRLNMGHRDLSLLLSRYVNMQNISKADAKEFFG